MDIYNQILLSIVIPVYNVEEYLSQCLESIFFQNLQNCEVICVNDGSTDSSAVILRRYADKYSQIRIIEQQNKGLSGARNTGLKEAKGEYVFFIDSDDYMLPNVIAKFLNLIKNNDVDIFIFNALIDDNIHYSQGLEKISNTAMSGCEYVQESYKIMRTFVTPIWLHLYRRAFLAENNLFFTEGLLHEDELFTPVTLLTAQKIQYFHIPIIYYRTERQGAITNILTEKRIRDKVTISRMLFDFFDENPNTPKEFFRKILEQYFITVRLIYLKDRKWLRFIQKEDYQIMRKCIYSEYETKSLKLLYISPKLMLSYQDNSLNKIIRKLINRFL